MPAIAPPPPDRIFDGIARYAMKVRFPPAYLVSRSWRKKLAETPRSLPAEPARHIEVVSHCWNYSSLLVYQLSSLVLFPPRDVEITMTVCYCRDDEDTVRLLDFFGDKKVPGVAWNWMEVPRSGIYRRGIGRNLAAKRSEADWVWFTDCDVLFAEGCLDSIAGALSESTEILVYPREERISTMLPEDDSLLVKGRERLELLSVDYDNFITHHPNRATGPLQICRGQVARDLGYCEALPSFHTAADYWQNTLEDSAFRKLLGTKGAALNATGVHRIRHVVKGKYRGGGYALFSWFRSWIRRTRDKIEISFKPGR